MIGTTFGHCLFASSVGRVEPDSDMHFGLLLYCSTAGRHGGLRDDLADLFWAGVEGDQAKHCLRQALYRLRLQRFPIYLQGGRVQLDGDVDVDVRKVLDGQLSGEQLVAVGGLPFLPGYAPRPGSQFGVWVETLRAEVSAALRRSLTDVVKEARSAARFREVHKSARALLAVDPLNEVATLALAEALAMDGSKVAAIRMLEEYEEEVGEVSASLRLPAQTLRQRVSENLGDALLPARYEVPFVGREAEFGLLRRMYAESRRGEARCAVITGEAGIGKTRLASELLRLAVLDGGTVASYTCSVGDSLSPLSSLLHLTKEMLGLPGALGCAQEHLTYLRRLVSGEGPSAAEAMSADLAYAQLVFCLSELAAAIADEAPFVVLIDDCHRLHRTSWQVFTDMVERAGSRSGTGGFMMMIAARHLPDWYGSLGLNGSGGMSQVLRLTAFGEVERRQFLAVWSEVNSVPMRELEVGVMVEASSGNPFYLAELAGHFGRGGDSLTPPPPIVCLVEQQFAALSRDAQKTLSVISLLGARATASRVGEVLGSPTAAVAAWLAELEVSGLVGSTGIKLAARHDIVADAARSLSEPSVLGLLRARVATSLEAEADRTRNIELLGDSLTQWVALDERERAFDVAMKLGEALSTVGFSADAAKSFETAADFALDNEARTRALTSALDAHFDSLAWYRVVELAPQLGITNLENSEQLSQTHFRVIEAAYWAGGFDMPPTLLEIARSQKNDPMHRLRAAELLAIRGDHEWDDGLIRKAGHAVRDLRGRDRGSFALLNLISAAATATRERVIQACEVYLGEPSKSEATRVRRLRVAADGFACVGERERARALLEESLSVGKNLRLVDQLHWASSILTVLHVSELRLDDAVTLANRHLTGKEQFLERWTYWVDQALVGWCVGDRARCIAAIENLQAFDHVRLTAMRFAQTLSTIAASVGAGRPLSEKLLNEGVALAARSRCRGQFDVSIAALLDALVQSDRTPEAALLYAGYHRKLADRSVKPAPILLRTAAPFSGEAAMVS
ncbi:MAG: AAA family ATPase [Gemmatimonadota bacterium]